MSDAITIPAWTLRAEGLTPHARIVLMVLHGAAGPTGTDPVRLSHSSLVRRTGLPLATVQRALRTLDAQGYLRRTRVFGRHTPNIIELLKHGERRSDHT